MEWWGGGGGGGGCLWVELQIPIAEYILYVALEFKSRNVNKINSLTYFSTIYSNEIFI